PVKLHNLTSNEVTVDVLHQVAVKQTCPDQVCLGSLMKQTKEFIDHDLEHDQGQVLAEARDFIQQFFVTRKSRNSAEHLKRINDIEREVLETGSYTHTYEELVFGSKLAWRNAA